MNSKSIDEIFLNERTCYHYLNKPIDHKLLHEIYDLMKMGPTSANCSPLRIVFVESKTEKEKLAGCVMEGNLPQIKASPVTALFAYDLKFYDNIPKLFAHNPGMKAYFSSSDVVTLDSATRNSTLQAAYFMMIARAKGLVCGPMSGFAPEKINNTFFAGTDYKINFICNLGYREAEETNPRLPRLDFDEVCKVV
mgnify:FL=1